MGKNQKSIWIRPDLFEEIDFIRKFTISGSWSTFFENRIIPKMRVHAFEKRAEDIKNMIYDQFKNHEEFKDTPNLKTLLDHVFTMLSVEKPDILMPWIVGRVMDNEPPDLLNFYIKNNIRGAAE